MEVVEWFDDGFRAEVEGSFCLTCGFYDYFDDLAYLIKERGYDVEVVVVEEREGGASVEYRLASRALRAQPRREILVFEWRRRDQRAGPSSGRNGAAGSPAPY